MFNIMTNCCYLFERLNNWIYSTVYPTSITLYDDVKYTFTPPEIIIHSQEMNRSEKIDNIENIEPDESTQWELMG